MNDKQEACLLANKFHDRWLGPFKVIKRCSDLVYKILYATSRKPKRVNFNLLKASSRINVRESIGYDVQTGETGEKSSEEEVPLINEILILPAVANAAVHTSTNNSVTAETTAPNQPAAYHLALQPQATNNSAIPDARIQSLAAPFAAIPVVFADHVSTVAAPPTVEPIVPQRVGTSATIFGLAQSRRQERRF